VQFSQETTRVEVWQIAEQTPFDPFWTLFPAIMRSASRTRFSAVAKASKGTLRLSARWASPRILRVALPDHRLDLCRAFPAVCLRLV